MISVNPPEPIAFTAASLPFIVASFHSFMLSALLWFQKSSVGKNQYTANRLLSALLLVLGLMLLDDTVDFTGHYYYAPHLIDTVVPLYFLVGPLLWGYIKVQTSPGGIKFRSRDLLHLLPALIKLLVMLPFILNTQLEAKIFYYYPHWFDLMPAEIIDADSSCVWYQLWQWKDCTITLSQVAGQPEFDLHLKSPLVWVWLSDIGTIALWLSLVAYIGSGFVRLKNHQAYLRQLTSNLHAKDLQWLLVFIALIALAAGVYVVFSFQDIFMEEPWLGTDERSYVTHLILAASVVYLGTLAMRQPIIFSDELKSVVETSAELPKKSDLRDETTNSDYAGNPETSQNQPNSVSYKYRNSPLTNDSKQEIRKILEDHLTLNKDYLDPDLSLNGLSDQVELRPHYVSQVINETIGMTFFDFINDYRLQEVKQRLQMRDRKPIIQIAIDAGFSSKTSFYAFFKKREGMSPSRWRKMSSVDRKEE